MSENLGVTFLWRGLFHKDLGSGVSRPSVQYTIQL